MKKFTLLILLFFCAVGFAQKTTLRAHGVDNPVVHDQQQKKQAVLNPTIPPQFSNSKAKNSVEYNIVFDKNEHSVVQEESQTGNRPSGDGTSATDPEGIHARTNTQSQNPIIGPQEARHLGGNNPIFYQQRTTPSNEGEIQAEILANRLYQSNNPSANDSPAMGNRPMADIIPTAGATETFTPDVGDHFFDPGGPGGSSTGGTPGNYPNCGCDTQTTLAGVSEIEFQYFSVFSTFDYLEIYDGTDASGTLLYSNGSGGPNSGDITLDDMIDSHGSASFTATSGNFFFFFHASAVVDYGGWDVEIIAAGGGGGSFPDPYCPISFSTVEPITLVEVAGISNRSSEVINGSPAHEDFTAIEGDMVEGQTYNVALEGNTNGNFTCSFTVFIDWNQDGVFDNGTERYDIGTIVNSTGTDGQQATNTITVPAGVADGPTRMRVVKKFGSTYPTDACTGTSWGQAEDYTMNVTSGGGGGGVCANPVLEVNQDVDDTCMANIGQGGLAQSYIPLEENSAGAGIKFRDPSTGLDVTLSLWDGLPNAGGTMLATATSQTDGGEWADVYWDPVVSVTVGTTYYIVIDGDPALPCIAGSTNDPYSDGMTFANDYSAFPNFDYTFRTYSCDSGGGSTACSQDHPFGAAAAGGSGSSVDSDYKTAADIVVAAGEDFILDTIEVPFLTFAPEDPPITANVVYYRDAGGLPGVMIGSETVVPTILSSGPWANPVAFQFKTSLAMTPFTFEGNNSSDTTYWIEVSMGTATNQGTVFWEYTDDIPVEGQPYAKYDASVGAWAIDDPDQEVIYTFSGNCEPLPPGNPCAQVGPSNNFEDGKSFTKNLGRIVANDVTVAADEDFILETINLTAFIGSQGSGVNADNVDIFIYEDAGGKPGTLITSQLNFVPTSQTVIGNNFGYDAWDVELDIDDVPLLGQTGLAKTYWIGISLEPTDGSNTFWEFSSAGVIGYGQSYNDGTGFVTEPTNEGVYTFAGTCMPIVGSSNDDCSRAIAVSCGDSVTGETITATDSGGNPAPDLFYKFTGTGDAQLVTVSLCGGGTDFDSVLRVFDDCDLANEIAFNDDFCGTQSQVTFQSDGTSTYYIMVEGFGSNSGNFSLDVTCDDPLLNDDCSGAIAVNCGDTVTGSTLGATVDSGVPACGPTINSPGVWYSFDDNSGLAGEITVSLCNGTDFDSKLSVYSGTCSNLVCIGGNDDFCGLQSEYTFATDGNTKFYILIHSFGGATGNYTLDVTCSPTPPPNDMIQNSIDVDEIGFPYTDPAVAMPAATPENGNPQGCDLTGANGVWYNFTPTGDGTAYANIVTPGGASSVTFYTAPNENAVETDLVLVPQNTNQCVPGTSASINTEAGQAYYVFVLNTGAITDIEIGGTNLGISNNAIEGFSYYPNPTTDMLNLSSNKNIEEVSIYNLLGQEVLSSKLEATSAALDISRFSTGTYMMKVTVDGETGIYKIIKK